MVVAKKKSSSSSTGRSSKKKVSSTSKKKKEEGPKKKRSVSSKSVASSAQTASKKTAAKKAAPKKTASLKPSAAKKPTVRKTASSKVSSSRSKSRSKTTSATRLTTKRAASKKAASRKGLSRNNDASDLSGDASMHERLAALEQDVSGAAKNLNAQMDDMLGLPPLPGSEENSSGDKRKELLEKESEEIFKPEFHSKKALDEHKHGFFEKILGFDEKKDGGKKSAKDATKKQDAKKKGGKKQDDAKKEGSLKQPEDLIDDLARDAKTGSLDNLKEFDEQVIEEKSDMSSSEYNELKRDAGELKKLEDEIGAQARRDGQDDQSDAQENGHPSSVPDAYRKEAPHQREIPLKMENKSSKKNGKGEKNDLDDMKSLPASDNSYKLEKKKGFFEKLFGSGKAKQKSDLKKKALQSSSQSSSESKKQDSVGLVDDRSIGPISAGKVQDEEKEMPLDDDFKQKKDVIPPPHHTQPKKLAPLEKVLGGKEESGSSPIEGADAQDAKAEQDHEDNKVEADDAGKVAQEGVTNTLDMPDKNEFSNSFVADALEDEIASRSGKDASAAQKQTDDTDAVPLESYGGGNADTSSSSSKSTSQKKKAFELQISKLETKRDNIKKELKELEEKLKENRSKYEDQTVGLKKREQELDRREQDLDERENILLTLQTDLIRERKELDNREFQLFMQEERAGLPKKPTITLSIEDEMKDLPEGMSDERMKIEQLLNQTRSFAVSKDFEKAKISYNRLVEMFHKSDMSPDEKKVVHLSIKELFNDINLLMKASTSE